MDALTDVSKMTICQHVVIVLIVSQLICDRKWQNKFERNTFAGL